MIQQLSQHPACSFEEAPESTRCGSASSHPIGVAELVHELRQPLSTIECLAYYLELTCADDAICQQMQRIQRLVWQVNHILEGSCAELMAHT
jgi:nitrogen-specific signal transduction histidine kinase